MAPIEIPDEWDGAARQVEDWLRAVGVGSQQRCLELTLAILKEAREAQGRHEPTAIAMETAFRKFESWAKSVFPEAAAERAGLQALVALHGSQPSRRQLALVLEKACPPDFSEQLSKFRIDASPEIRLSKMTARKMKYGPIEAIAQETWHRFAWAPLFQALVIWTAIFLILLRWLAPKAPL
jgi:hypothetical protein